ncbi:SGNH/GDSL hydrolase family protein [Streptomyces europaeiscabiei]|uniref:hypothetical protein n=1 Tax=Streptomyces europaeiscabiei TaxID=146819 RepID=UPI0029BFB1FD|nr:hypothetical protein [Streptomyces europaeiscabiei]
MNTSLRAGLAGALACGVLVTAMSAGRDGGGGGDASAPPTGPYVALGDSYTAGPGIPDRSGTPAGCERSGRNYPALVAARLKIEASDFHDVSCTGATIADLSAPPRRPTTAPTPRSSTRCPARPGWSRSASAATTSASPR